MMIEVLPRGVVWPTVTISVVYLHPQQGWTSSPCCGSSSRVIPLCVVLWDTSIRKVQFKRAVTSSPEPESMEGTYQVGELVLDRVEPVNVEFMNVYYELFRAKQ